MPEEWLEAAMRKAEAAVLEQEEMEVSLLVKKHLDNWNPRCLSRNSTRQV